MFSMFLIMELIKYLQLRYRVQPYYNPLRLLQQMQLQQDRQQLQHHLALQQKIQHLKKTNYNHNFDDKKEDIYNHNDKENYHVQQQLLRKQLRPRLLVLLRKQLQLIQNQLQLIIRYLGVLKRITYML